MNEKQLIAKLQELRQIKPSKDWAVSLKKEIIGEEKKASILEVLPQMIFHHKMAYATVTVFAILIGLFGFAQNTVPGDFLFPVKKIAEKSQGALLFGVEQSKYNLDIANRRLEELTQIVKENKTQNLGPAIQEFKDTINEAVKTLPKDASDFEEIATQVQQLQRNKRNLETLGVVVTEESNTLNNALAPLVENEIKTLSGLSDSGSLTLEQEIRLVEVKSHYKKGEYTAALEKILLITNS